MPKASSYLRLAALRMNQANAKRKTEAMFFMIGLSTGDRLVKN